MARCRRSRAHNVAASGPTHLDALDGGHSVAVQHHTASIPSVLSLVGRKGNHVALRHCITQEGACRAVKCETWAGAWEAHTVI